MFFFCLTLWFFSVPQAIFHLTLILVNAALCTEVMQIEIFVQIEMTVRCSWLQNMHSIREFPWNKKIDADKMDDLLREPKHKRYSMVIFFSYVIWKSNFSRLGLSSYTYDGTLEANLKKWLWHCLVINWKWKRQIWLAEVSTFFSPLNMCAFQWSSIPSENSNIPLKWLS